MKYSEWILNVFIPFYRDPDGYRGALEHSQYLCIHLNYYKDNRATTEEKVFIKKLEATIKRKLGKEPTLTYVLSSGSWGGKDIRIAWLKQIAKANKGRGD